MPLVVPGVTTKGSATDEWSNKLVGKKLSDGVTNEINFNKQELPQKHRVIPEGSMTTMDFVQDRLNVHLDKDGTVARVSHG